ncbi:TIGR03668 family PPOX class F420-dependent oxidoreductase [Angustibacter luteus]|uniref:TIGR03668 family PPOX class F420-dependent oxidoreductase n=1 Tax=Angustibacter luteus TaxID=658456 RepID=A0ABW1JAS9_9ACTN
MDGEQARARFADARVARLATVDAQGRPHVVPLVFAVDGDRVVSAVDHKPKRSNDLRRLANIAANPAVALLVDHYADDWTTLWWVRADGRARVLAPDDVEAGDALDRLASRYPQYVEQRPDGPVLVVDVDRWTGWTAS